MLQVGENPAAPPLFLDGRYWGAPPRQDQQQATVKQQFPLFTRI